MTHPIAKAIAERMRPYTAVYDLVADVEAGAIDDLLPAYTTEVATVGNTRYLMPSEPLYVADTSSLTTADGRIVEWRSTQRPVLSEETIEWLCTYAASYFQVDSLADFLDQDDGCGMSTECERKASELRAWEKWKEKTR